MRVPDTLLQSNFMKSVSKNKNALAQIQYQLTTQSKVNTPSDNPLSNSRIMRLQSQMNNILTYKSNIDHGMSMIEDSILSMEGIQSSIQDTMIELTKLNSAIADADSLNTFAHGIDTTIDMLVDLANSDFNGQYSFGGTDSGTKPFYYDKVNNKVISNSKYLGGDRTIKIASNITQKINISGKDLFQSVVSQEGSLDSSAGVGASQTTSSKIFDAEGNEYTLNLTYTSTSANNYQLDYSIVDSNSNTIQNNTVTDIKFNSETGEFESIGGEKFGEIKIENTTTKIDLVLDLNSVNETNSPASLSSSLNQKADIFNTLISIKEKLLAGEKPTARQTQLVNEFNQHILNKLSEAGGIANKLTSSGQILLNREIEIVDLLSKEKDVDVARALIDLQNRQYALDISYRISSMIMPTSLLDYL